MLRRTRLLSLVLSGFAVISFYYFVPWREVEVAGEGLKGGNNRKIVAFSLKKQIQIESEEVDCDGKFSFGEKSDILGLNQDEKLWTHLNGTNIFIYSVNFDARLHPHNYLRIISMVKGTPKNNLFCQIFTSDHRYHITKAVLTNIWSRTWNQNDTHLYHNPFLISCHLPLNKISLYLSLTNNPCQIASQKFTIVNTNVQQTVQKNVATICVKPLHFPKDEDMFKHLLQWITINRVIGIKNIDIYIETVPKKTYKLLEKTKKVLKSGLNLLDHKKVVDDVNLDEATHIWQKRRYEIIAYNDCLYRNIHTSHFIIPLDIDEIIVPRHGTLAELLNRTLLKGKDDFASYTVRNAYYLRHFNKKETKKMSVFFFESTVRSDYSEEGESGKSFVSTKNALTVFNHYALKSLRPGVGTVNFLDKSLVQMNHYKDDCDTVLLPECAKYLSSPIRVVDDVVFKFRKKFFAEYNRLLRGLIHS